MLATACRSAKERNLFVFALIFSAMVWLAIVVSIVGLLYAPFVALGVVVAHAFFLARLTGNAIRVGTRQLPELYKRVESAASKLGMERMPEVYVVTGGGILNAFATKLFSRQFVILNSEILDACEALDEGKGPSEPRAVDFIIGHELGHLALGHLSWNWLLWPAKLVPLLGPAYSRACEYSCDATGLAACDDVTTAGKALAVLAAGGRHARQVNLEALVEQRHETGGFIMALVELNSSHPYLSKRVAAVQRLRDGGFTPEVGRNPFAYLFAPFFAGATTYLMAYVAVVGVMAAVALPSFMKFQERSKAAAGLGAFDALGGLEGAPASDPFAALATPPADDAQALGALGQLGALSGGDAQANADAAALLAALQANAEAANANKDAQIANVFGTGGLGTGAANELPTNDVGEEAPRFDARTWLKGQAALKNKTAVSGTTTAKAQAFVEKLYKTGAKKVYVSDVSVDEEGMFAGEIIAEMPAKAAARKALVNLCTAEFAKQGYEEPCEDGGVDALYFYWD